MSDQNSSLTAEISRVSIEKKKLSSLPQSPAFQPLQFTDTLDVSERQYESKANQRALGHELLDTVERDHPRRLWMFTCTEEWVSLRASAAEAEDVYAF